MSSRKNRKNYKKIPEKSIERSTSDIPVHQPRFRLRWIPSSEEEYAASETKLLTYLSDPYEIRDISAGTFIENSDEGWLPWIFGQTPTTQTTKQVKLRTLFVNKLNRGTPLVIINGLGMGCATLISMITGISYPGPVIVLDLPGFARSTKLKFPKKAHDAESTFINVLEGWRSNLGLKKFVLAGLSFGGYIATSYTLSYPNRVVHLIAIDPWGFVHKPEKVTSLLQIENPIAIRLFVLIASIFNLITIHLILGPWGPWALTRNFGIFNTAFDSQLGVEGAHKVMNDYEFHGSATPNLTGLDAYWWMSRWIVYAKEPLCDRLHKLRVNITMILAEKSWVPRISRDEMESLLGQRCALEYITIPLAAHENIIFLKELEHIFHKIIVREGWANK